MYENEEKWLNYDEEDIEVAVFLSDMFFKNIIKEITVDLISITGKRKEEGYFVNCETWNWFKTNKMSEIVKKLILSLFIFYYWTIFTKFKIK